MSCLSSGGAYDTVPEVCLLLGLFNASTDKYVPILFDEAGEYFGLTPRGVGVGGAMATRPTQTTYV